MKRYFPNLNSLRFFAAALVVMHHIEQFKGIYSIPNFWNVPFVRESGKLGVYFFFVLSGFLITFLLMDEKENTNSVDIKRFYFKRVLRIWPVYFLIVFLGFFVFPQIDFMTLPENSIEVVQESLWLKLSLFALFLPNVAKVIFGPTPFVAPTWSIGVEEQFYIIWPILLKKSKNIKKTLVSVIIAYLVLDFLLKTMASNGPQSFKLLRDIWISMPIQCMAIGGYFAYLCRNKFSDGNGWLFNSKLQWSVLALTLILVGSGYRFGSLHEEMYSIVFGLLISGLACSKKPILNLEIKWLSYLGKISYGMYIYHGFVIVASMQLLMKLNLFNNLNLYLLSFVLTTLISVLSYETFEKWFLSKGR